MDLPQNKDLSIQDLSHIFDNKSECYKLFWFEAILNKVVLYKKEKISFNELVNEMVANAWYMVAEYHLNLGPIDKLEELVHYAYNISNGKIKTSDTKENIISYLNNCEDQKIKDLKKILINNVPYRLQSTFMPSVKGKVWDVSKKKLAERINKEENLMYYFSEINGLDSYIFVNEKWIDYFNANMMILKGWIEYNKITYLQRRNPSVPGISCKLYPEQERNLGYVKKYWKSVLMIKPIYEIYGHNTIKENDIISIDHFIPWSYVAHDEFWNLSPTTTSINSSKSNNLPNWGIYFKLLCDIEYEAYTMVWNYDTVHKTFEKCIDNNVNSEYVKKLLYYPDISKEKFYNNLEEIMLPVYKSAEKMGFKNWTFN